MSPEGITPAFETAYKGTIQLPVSGKVSGKSSPFECVPYWVPVPSGRDQTEASYLSMQSGPTLTMMSLALLPLQEVEVAVMGVMAAAHPTTVTPNIGTTKKPMVPA